MKARTFVLIAAFSLAASAPALAQGFYGPGHFGMGSPDAGGVNDNFVARNMPPFGPDGTGRNYEYFRSSGPDRGNSIESQR